MTFQSARHEGTSDKLVFLEPIAVEDSHHTATQDLPQQERSSHLMADVSDSPHAVFSHLINEIHAPQSRRLALGLD